MKIDETLYRGADHYDHSFAKETAYPYHLGPPEKSPTFPIWEAVLELLGTPESAGRILEIGCGCGQFARLAIDRGFEYGVGIDFSLEAVNRSREQCPDGCFEVEDVERCGIPWQGEERFSTIVLVEVLEHLKDDLAVLSAIPAGKRIVASVPSFLTVGHVRAFDRGIADVYERYDGLLDVLAFQELARGGNRWTVFFAIRTGPASTGGMPSTGLYR